MPSSLSTNIAHTEVTDHRILRRPDRSSSPVIAFQDQAPLLPRLLPFPPTKNDPDVRDLALAWVSLEGTGTVPPNAETERLLRAAVKESPNDPAVLTALAYREQRKGDNADARELYQKAIALDPTLVDAAANLGVIEANSGSAREAIALWEAAFRRAPAQSSIGMNLARLLCDAGEPERARDYVLRVLEFNPDLPDGRKLLERLNSNSPNCGKR